MMALAKGTSKVLTGPLSLHTRTAIHFCEKLTQVHSLLNVDVLPSLLLFFVIKVLFFSSPIAHNVQARFSTSHLSENPTLVLLTYVFRL